MLRCLLFPIIAFLSVILVSGVSIAETEANQDYQYSGWTAGLGLGAYFFEMDEELNSGILLELKGGYDISDHISIEGSLGYLPYLEGNSPRAEQDPDVWHIDSTSGARSSIELLYHLDSDPYRDWDPLLALSAGVNYYENSLENDQHFDPFGGFGVGLGRTLNRNWVARGDYRLLLTGHDTEWNHTVLMSLLYRWGNGTSFGGEGSGLETGEAGKMVDNNLKPIYFNFDRSDIVGDSVNRLQHNADYLKKRPNLKVTIEGHCDERGTDEYNYALGERRARSTKEYLSDLGVDSERLDTVSYGEDRPAVAGSNEAAWAKNRRAECVARQ
jgi:peptidoglycan-associated lipoprotein